MSETILIVDDEAAVRILIRRILTQRGYVALEAGSAADAERVWRACADNIALVILDVVMPGGGGLDIANELNLRLPGISILYISGYVDSVAVESIRKRKPDAVLIKPFHACELLSRVRDLLGPVRLKANASLAVLC